MIAKHDEREFPCEKCEITVRGRLQLKARKRNTKKSHAKNVGKVCLTIVPHVTKQSVWAKISNVRTVGRCTRESTI